MTTERFPARRAGTMVCGHPIACMYRWKAQDGVHKYCVACLFEKSGLKDVDTLTREYTEEKLKEISEKNTIKDDIIPPVVETPKPAIKVKKDLKSATEIVTKKPEE